MLIPRPFLRPLLFALVSAGLGGLLAFWAPYGSDALNWPGRWFYWTLMNAVGWAAGLTCEVCVRRWLKSQSVMLNYGLVALAATVVVFIATALFFQLRGASWDVGTYLAAGLQVAVLVGVVTAVYALVRERAPTVPAEAHRPKPEVGEALLAQLPTGFRGCAIDALGAEDHYLRVLSDGRRALIRMRLRDALLAVASLDGAQTHRSWWVAREAVQAVRRENGKLVLVLRGGVTVPVSRTHAPRLREAGWF